MQFCSFTYAAFTLAVIYFILFILVIRYLHNLISHQPHKKSAQKLFLGILVAQTLLRIGYFILFPFNSIDACEPTLTGHKAEDVRSTSWWIHLLSNVPAILFLMAFSVLVYTFARIYHKVLLAGVWFQERRFKILTIVLILLNTIACVATLGDWIFAAVPRSRASFFVNLMLYCILCLSTILAIFFLAYGTLLYYQVQSIIRASSENVTTTTSTSISTHRHHHHHHHSSGISATYQSHGGGSFSNGHGGTHQQSYRYDNDATLTNGRDERTGGRKPQYGFTSSASMNGDTQLTFPTSTATGFTPIVNPNGNGTTSTNNSSSRRKSAYNSEEEEDQRIASQTVESSSPTISYRPPVLPPPLSIKPGSSVGGTGTNGSGNGNSGTGFGNSASLSNQQQRESSYPIAGFASPNLPTPSHASRKPNPHGEEDEDNQPQISHSYVSTNGDFTPDSLLSGANTPETPTSSTTNRLNNGVMTSPNMNITSTTTTQNGSSNSIAYVASVSPEYGQLPTTTTRRVTLIASGTSTPTDALLGSVPYEQQPIYTPKRTSSLSRPSANSSTIAATNGHANGTTSIPRSSISQHHARTSILSHSPPEDDDTTTIDDHLTHDHYGTAAAEEENGYSRRERERRQKGVTNGETYSYPTVSPTQQERGIGGGGSDMHESLLLSASPSSLTSSSSIHQHSQPLLSHPVPPPSPPNPMRKIAVIAAICTVCLLLRTILIIVIDALGQNFAWYTTLLYFALSEILPLLAMLKVFNTPTPLVHVLGSGGGGGGGGGF